MKIKAMHADQRRPTDISRMLKVGRTSVYRALKGEQSDCRTVWRRSISLQPGPEAKELPFKRDVEKFARDDYSIPQINSYLEASNRMAKKVKELFATNNELQDSVAYPLIFYRAKNFAQCRASAIWRTEEAFCFKKAAEIITKLQPISADEIARSVTTAIPRSASI